MLALRDDKGAVFNDLGTTVEARSQVKEEEVCS